MGIHVRLRFMELDEKFKKRPSRTEDLERIHAAEKQIEEQETLVSKLQVVIIFIFFLSAIGGMQIFQT